MSDYSLLFDVAKVHQVEVARKAEAARMVKKQDHGHKANKLVSKLRTLLTTRS